MGINAEYMGTFYFLYYKGYERHLADECAYR